MLAILTTHPIQYQVPLWQMLARDGGMPFEVWYLTTHGIKPSRDREFRKTFAWDIDVVAGYPHRFLQTPAGATPNSFWQCRFAESLGDLLRKHDVTALWIQGWQVLGYWQAVWTAHSAGVEVWLRGESNDLRLTAGWKRIAKRLLLGQFFRRVDRFLCIGTANRRLYQKFGVPDERLYDAPYAVDNERFAAQAAKARQQRAEIRKQWGIAEDAFCVLFCGKFIPKKRPMDVVHAAQSLLAGHPSLHIHLLFVGSGELGTELRGSCNVLYDAEDLNLSLLTDHSSLPPASFTGFLNQTEISCAYVAADVLVLPSDYEETWGLVVNEAIATGLPCVISDHCGCAEDLGRWAGNAVYECGETSRLADTLRHVHSQPQSGVIGFPPDLSITVAAVRSLIGNRSA